MKKITLLIMLMMPAIAGFSQAKLVNAIKYLADYQKNKDQKSLAKAKENIDLFLQTPDPKDAAKAQKVKAQVYLSVFENNLSNEMDKLTTISDPNIKTLTAYQNTPTGELDEAVKAFATTKTLDTKGIYALDIMTGEKQIFYHYFNKGIANSNAEKLPEAIDMYEKAEALDDSQDSILLNNLATSALYYKKFDKAKTNFTKLIDANKGSASTYNSLVESYFNLNDTLHGIEVLKKGRSVYPDDEKLLNTETNYFLSSGKSAEALKNLNTIIASRPQEASLYAARASIYDKLANPVDGTGKELPKPADYAEKNKMAEADYKKAAEIYEGSYKTIESMSAQEADQLRRSYAQTLFNLGVIYFNNGANISKKADRITDNAKFAAENKKANEEFKKALPHLEKSQELVSDPQTMYALKQIYSRLEMSDKLKALNDQMKN